VLDALMRALLFSLDVVSVGEHGLLRMLSSDWDDGLDNPLDAYNTSESVLTSALAVVVLPRFAEVLRLVGNDTMASRCEEQAEELRAAMMKHAWNGQWLRRAWLGSQVGWIGDLDNTGNLSGLYSAQQGFALLGGVFDEHVEDLAAVLESLEDRCRGPYGYNYLCFNNSGSGDSGNWAALDHPLLMGLARMNQTALAWTQFLRNTMQWQATMLPSMWVGIWTAGDHVQPTVPVNYTDAFPGLCIHRHAWPLVSFPFLAGVQFTAEGISLRLSASLCQDQSCSLRTQLFELRCVGESGAGDHQRRMTGWYNPGRKGMWSVSVDIGDQSGGQTVLTVSDAAGRARSKSRSAAMSSTSVLSIGLDHAVEKVFFEVVWTAM
jgi:hypothetical protein